MASTEELIDGFKHFRKYYFGDDNRLYASIKDGQSAKSKVKAELSNATIEEQTQACEQEAILILPQAIY